MTYKLFYLLILLGSLLSCKKEISSIPDSLEKSKIEQLDSLANRYLELNRFSGVILVTRNNTTIYNNSFGFADYENRKPFSNQTSFKIGEISEYITAQIIREMVQGNKFQLSDMVSEYLPEIKFDFTINDLLNHKTNLASIQTIQEQNPALPYSSVTYANLAIQSSAIAARSDLNYNILGLLIEKISGKSFQENIEKYSQDLGLENTYFKKADSTLAVGYLYHNYQGNGLKLQKAPESNLDITFSSNGLKSTASDLSKIIRANSEFKLEIEGYLENDGFSYSVVNNPQNKIISIVLSNRRHPVAQEISTSIASILEGKAYQLPLARKPVDIDKTVLKDYSGRYALNETMSLEVLHENDSLFVTMGPNKIPLIPQSANQFYMEQMDTAMRFLRDTVNLVNEVVLLDGFLDGNTIKRVEK